MTYIYYSSLSTIIEMKSYTRPSDNLVLMIVHFVFPQSVGNALACATLENDGFWPKKSAGASALNKKKQKLNNECLLHSRRRLCTSRLKICWSSTWVEQLLTPHSAVHTKSKYIYIVVYIYMYLFLRTWQPWSMVRFIFVRFLLCM